MTQLEATLATSELRVENERLRAELRARLVELRAYRARLVNAVYAERRRLERDLHDGAQGRLVSLALSLGLLEAKLSTDPDGARPIAREAREAVAAALEELRELSRGIYPAVLTERGLGPALAELCERVSMSASLELSLDRRLSPAVEAASYFVVSEALTNALKHADASRVQVAASYRKQRLIITVSDNGTGGATAAAGSGLRGLANRVEALGGRLSVSSPDGRGTTVRAELPCE
jgi:signal transduction histidine kinase